MTPTQRDGFGTQALTSSAVWLPLQFTHVHQLELHRANRLHFPPVNTGYWFHRQLKNRDANCYEMKTQCRMQPETEVGRCTFRMMYCCKYSPLKPATAPQRVVTKDMTTSHCQTALREPLSLSQGVAPHDQLSKCWAQTPPSTQKSEKPIHSLCFTTCQHEKLSPAHKYSSNHLALCGRLRF